MKNLANKWLLLDTNVLIEQLLHSEEFFWDDFSGLIKSLNCKKVITPEIEFELLRGMLSLSDAQNFEEFIKKSEIDILGGSRNFKDLWKMSTVIGQIYSLNRCKDIDAIDCVIAAYCQIYNKNLYLATFNNKHFPTKLFDREAMLNFEIEDEIKVLGIYRFSEEKFKNLNSKREKSNAKKFSR